jgi:hypothetical protein
MLQVFESHAEFCGPELFDKFCLPYLSQICLKVKEKLKDQGLKPVPMVTSEFFVVKPASKFYFVVVLVLVADTSKYCIIVPSSPCFQHIAPLPGSLARQPCPAALPGSLARQPCPEALPGSLARQPCPAALKTYYKFN